MTSAAALPPAAFRGNLVLIVPFWPRECCVACRALLTGGQAEPVPTKPWQRRCKDEDGCRQRFTPRRLARSVRRLP